MHRSDHIDPIIGSWYDSKEMPESFVVLDDVDDSIQIQYFDGEIDRIDHESWDAMHMEPIAEPEDPTAAYEMEHEDILNILNELEDRPDADLEYHLRHLDTDNSEWR